MWLVGADQVVGLVMVVMGSRSDKNNSLAELYKSHMVDNKSHPIITSPPPRNGTLVLLPVVLGTGWTALVNDTPAALALAYSIRRATAVKLGILVKIEQNIRMTASNIDYSNPPADSQKQSPVLYPAGKTGPPGRCTSGSRVFRRPSTRRGGHIRSPGQHP